MGEKKKGTLRCVNSKKVAKSFQLCKLQMYVFGGSKEEEAEASLYKYTNNIINNNDEN